MTEIFESKTIDETLSRLNEQIKLSQRKWLDHFDAHTVDDAIRLLSQYAGEAKVIAGGLDLLGLLKNRLIAPRVLVNIKTIPGLAYITEDAEGLKLGALTTITDIEKSPLIKEKYGILAETARVMAAPTIRNMATIAGNLCQQVRCWYYRRSPLLGLAFNCLRKGGEQCYAADGENQFHAIIGAKECHAVCPSDMASSLIALGATLKIAGPNGDKVVPVERFFTPMGNILEPDELITEIQVPSLAKNTKQHFLKFRLRKAIDFAITSVAAIITTEGEIVREAKIVLGGVSPTPYRAGKVEEMLRGQVITPGLAEAAANAAVSEAVPLAKNLYKVPITEALVKRAILS